jgi:thymidylate synthase (FAD)
MKAVKNGNLQPQAIRGVLPNDLLTTIVVSANPREWRTILKLRTSPAAHPDMRRVMIPLLDKFVDMYPVLFQDIKEGLK